MPRTSRPDRARWSIEVFDHEDEAVTAALKAGLTAHADAQGQPFEKRDLLITARDEAGTLVAGLSGNFAYTWLYVALLWVDEAHRGAGLGRTLLQRAEQLARARGSRGVYLSTFGFQARHFYEKLGYRVFGELEDEIPERTRYYLRRTLAED